MMKYIVAVIVALVAMVGMGSADVISMIVADEYSVSFEMNRSIEDFEAENFQAHVTGIKNIEAVNELVKLPAVNGISVLAIKSVSPARVDAKNKITTHDAMMVLNYSIRRAENVDFEQVQITINEYAPTYVSNNDHGLGIIDPESVIQVNGVNGTYYMDYEEYKNAPTPLTPSLTYSIYFSLDKNTRVSILTTNLVGPQDLQAFIESIKVSRV